jgi:hypothetical protein
VSSGNCLQHMLFSEALLELFTSHLGLDEGHSSKGLLIPRAPVTGNVSASFRLTIQKQLITNFILRKEIECYLEIFQSITLSPSCPR